MCPICQEMCTNPTTAACMAHTFCLNCLAAWIRARATPKCPSCNFPLNTDPDTLRVNTDIAHAISLLRRSHAVSPPADGAHESATHLLRRLFARLWEQLTEAAAMTLTVYFVQPVNQFVAVIGVPFHRALETVYRIFRSSVGRIYIFLATRSNLLLSFLGFASALFMTARMKLRAYCTLAVRTPRVRPRRAVPAKGRISCRAILGPALVIILVCCIFFDATPLTLFAWVIKAYVSSQKAVLVKRLEDDAMSQGYSWSPIFQACHTDDAEAVHLLLSDASAVDFNVREKKVSCFISTRPVVTFYLYISVKYCFMSCAYWLVVRFQSGKQ